MTVKFQHSLRIVTFYHCDTIQEARSRFQWRFGYWPSDTQIVEVIHDNGDSTGTD